MPASGRTGAPPATVPREKAPPPLDPPPPLVAAPVHPTPCPRTSTTTSLAASRCPPRSLRPLPYRPPDEPPRPERPRLPRPCRGATRSARVAALRVGRSASGPARDPRASLDAGPGPRSRDRPDDRARRAPSDGSVAPVLARQRSWRGLGRAGPATTANPPRPEARSLVPGRDPRHLRRRRLRAVQRNLVPRAGPRAPARTAQHPAVGAARRPGARGADRADRATPATMGVRLDVPEAMTHTTG